MFGDEIKYICRLCWRFIIDASDRQQWPVNFSIQTHKTRVKLIRTKYGPNSNYFALALFSPKAISYTILVEFEF
jgi:hypothetical protein